MKLIVLGASSPRTVPEASYVVGDVACVPVRELVSSLRGDRSVARVVLRVAAADGEASAAVGSVGARVVLDVARAAKRGGEVQETVATLDEEATAACGDGRGNITANYKERVSDLCLEIRHKIGRTSASEGLEVASRGGSSSRSSGRGRSRRSSCCSSCGGRSRSGRCSGVGGGGSDGDGDGGAVSVGSGSGRRGRGSSSRGDARNGRIDLVRGSVLNEEVLRENAAVRVVCVVARVA